MADTLFVYNFCARDVFGQVIPGATVIVLSGDLSSVNTSTQPGTPLATIYTDPAGANQVNQSTNPLVTDGFGEVCFCVAKSGYFVLQVYGSGINGQYIRQISS